MKTGTVIKEQPSVVKAADYLGETRNVMARLDTNLIDRISDQIWQAYEQDRTVYLFGNGGSAALASHLACDLAKGTAANGRRRLRAVSLNDNAALVTALANDHEYAEIFAEQLHHIEPGDVALAISSSGNSPNVVRGLEVAQQAGATTIAVSGFKGGRVKSLCDMCLVVPSDNVQYIEDSHLSVMHAIFSAVRQRMLNSADRE
ncbi:MAG TPA: SIS domain-containing protein [Terriglobales bacterium]